MAAAGVDAGNDPLRGDLSAIEVRPKRTTYTEWCLHRIATALEQLVELNAPSAPPDMTELAEDFPGREALAEAGILYYETLHRTGAELAAAGLDEPTVNRVLTRLRSEG